MPSQFLPNDPDRCFRFADRAYATFPGSAPGKCGRPSTAACSTPCRDLVSAQAVQERLELLLALDVPCEVKVAIPSGHTIAGWGIRRTERRNGYFSLIGENYSFHVNEECMEVACVGITLPEGGRSVELEILGAAGWLCARVVCPRDSMAGAWCDVLDSLVYACKDHPRVPSHMGFQCERPVATSLSGRTAEAQSAEIGSGLSPLSAPVC